MASFSSSFPIDSSLLLHLPSNANFVQLNYQPAARTLDNHGIINHEYCNNEASVMSTVMTSRNSSTSMDASSLVTTDHQQKDDVVKKKRKCKEGSFANSAQSKDKREKKQRKTKDIGEVKEIKVCKEESKDAPTGYIHVRARRGQATDRHSLAERVRRERISERMNLLQSLVPGCDKVTGKALVLDEIINYVQSLQNQVEVLSMRLASTNPMFLDFGMDIEPFMDQNLSNLASPILPSMQGYNPATASAQVQDGLPLENRQVLYEMDEQSQIFIRQCTGFSNNLYSCN